MGRRDYSFFPILLKGNIMNYKELRKSLLDTSGRSDLIDPATYADSGIRSYINAGLRWLDMNFQGQAMRKRYFEHLFEGSYVLAIPYCRVIEEIWMYDGETRWQLDKYDVAYLRTIYPNSWRDVEKADPLYYAINTIDLYESTRVKAMGDSTFMATSADVSMGDASNHKGILILPPLERELSIEVWGLFYTPELIADTDTNWWMMNFPSTVIDATMREIEIKHRNTQGVNDWTSAIMSVLVRIEQDQAEEVSNDINEMEG